MSNRQSLDTRSGHMVDISSGEKGKSKKKTPKYFAPIVQQTINLSTPNGDDFEAVNETPNPKSQGKKSGKPATSATNAPRVITWRI